MRSHLINPYKKKTTEEERENFREEHPEIDDVLKIIKEIDISTSTQYLNAQRILEWIKGRRPQEYHLQTPKMRKKKKLGNAWVGIGKRLINPYKKKTTAEEREKFREEHPEIDAILEIIKEIKISTSTQYLNAQTIQEWIKRQEKPKLPSKESKTRKKEP